MSNRKWCLNPLVVCEVNVEYCCIVVNLYLKVEAKMENSLLSAHGKVRSVYNNFGIAGSFLEVLKRHWNALVQDDTLLCE